MSGSENKDNIFSRKNFQLLVDQKAITSFVKPVKNRIEINIEPAQRISKPGIGLVSENYLSVTNQDLSNLTILGNFDKVVFKNCNFSNSVISNQAKYLYFENCNLSETDFSQLSELEGDHVYLSAETCLLAKYHNDKSFKKSLKNILAEKEREQNSKSPWLLTINGDFSPISSDLVALISGSKTLKTTREDLMVENEIAPTKAQSTNMISKGRKIEK